MTMTTSVNKQPTATVGEPYTTGSVTSHDGTTISYRQLGHGPGWNLPKVTCSSPRP